MSFGTIEFGGLDGSSYYGEVDQDGLIQYNGTLVATVTLNGENLGVVSVSMLESETIGLVTISLSEL